jgi:hypothetical protein
MRYEKDSNKIEVRTIEDLYRERVVKPIKAKVDRHLDHFTRENFPEDYQDTLASAMDYVQIHWNNPFKQVSVTRALHIMGGLSRLRIMRTAAVHNVALPRPELPLDALNHATALRFENFTGEAPMLKHVYSDAVIQALNKKERSLPKRMRDIDDSMVDMWLREKFKMGRKEQSILEPPTHLEEVRAMFLQLTKGSEEDKTLDDIFEMSLLNANPWLRTNALQISLGREAMWTDFLQRLIIEREQQSILGNYD